jgi:hypothetical protein
VTSLPGGAKGLWRTGNVQRASEIIRAPDYDYGVGAASAQCPRRLPCAVVQDFCGERSTGVRPAPVDIRLLRGREGVWGEKSLVLRSGVWAGFRWGDRPGAGSAHRVEMQAKRGQDCRRREAIAPTIVCLAGAIIGWLHRRTSHLDWRPRIIPPNSQGCQVTAGAGVLAETVPIPAVRTATCGVNQTSPSWRLLCADVCTDLASRAIALSRCRIIMKRAVGGDVRQAFVANRWRAQIVPEFR